MALYAIGDVQGCDAELGALLGALRFSADAIDFGLSATWSIAGPIRWRRCAEFALWRCGDGHPRESRSALTGRGFRIRPRSQRRYPERDSGRARSGWPARMARGRPLLHEDHTLNMCMLHAGLAPQWDLARRGSAPAKFEQALRRDPKDCWTPCTAINRTAGTMPSQASNACDSS